MTNPTETGVELRMHDYEAKCLHLVYPGLVLFSKFGNGRPLVLSP